MAKSDNLTDFLVDLANTIRAKKGIETPIDPQDFSKEIESIGTSTSVVILKDVNFYDYDGTLLYSFTKNEFLNITSFPELPVHEGLISQGWNYSLEDAKDYVEDYGVLDIGATYITDDDKTRLYIRIAAPGRMDVPLYFNQTVSGGVTIDWGDGSDTVTLSGTGNVSTTHTYAEIGDYCISLSVNSGTLDLGHMSVNRCVLGEVQDKGRVYSNMLQKVYLGKGISAVSRYAFYYCQSLSSVVIPSGVTLIDNHAFYYCRSLSSVVIPSSVTSIGSHVFYYCSSLSSVVIPSGVTTTITANAFHNCYSLPSVVIPSGVTTIFTYAFDYCSSLSSVVIPSGVTTIGNYAFYYCYSLSSVVIPSSVTSIGEKAFSDCYGMKFYDFSNAEKVPTLLSTSGFSNITSDCKIVVPDDLYDSWIAATNWSDFSSYIVKESEYPIN